MRTGSAFSRIRVLRASTFGTSSHWAHGTLTSRRCRASCCLGARTQHMSHISESDSTSHRSFLSRRNRHKQSIARTDETEPNTWQRRRTLCLCSQTAAARLLIAPQSTFDPGRTKGTSAICIYGSSVRPRECRLDRVIGLALPPFSSGSFEVAMVIANV